MESRCPRKTDSFVDKLERNGVRLLSRCFIMMPPPLEILGVEGGVPLLEPLPREEALDGVLDGGATPAPPFPGEG